MISCQNEEEFRSLLIMTINWFFLTRQFLYIWSSPVRISGQFGGSLRISPPALASIEINMQQASMPSSYVHATCQIGRSRKSRWHKYKSTNELITGKENNYKANVHWEWWGVAGGGGGTAGDVAGCPAKFRILNIAITDSDICIWCIKDTRLKVFNFFV